MAILTNIRVLWISLIVLILLNIFTLAALWTTRTHRAIIPSDKKYEGPESFLREKLKFNDDQIIRFKEIKTKQKEELMEKINEIKALREDMMTMMRIEDFNDSVQIIVDRIGEKQAEIDRLNYNHFRELLLICDDSQKEVFIESMQKAFMPDYGRRRHIQDMKPRDEKGK
jgi:hypothetical protein